MTQTLSPKQASLANCTVHPTISVTDIGRAKNFYSETLGLDLVKEDDMKGLVFSAGGDTNLYVYERSDPPKAENTVASFNTEDLEASMEALRKNGVGFEEYDLPGLKTENGVVELGGQRGCWFKDPDGNIFGLFEGVID
jgi:catechol 2,3-dioxygenase-like lactoylglutathione lyase family enzyme